MRLLNIREEG